MKSPEHINKRVAKHYWQDDINCALTTLKILAETFNTKLHSQVIDASIGMHGAGGYGAQCGLVEGALMFIGISDKARGLADEDLIKNCRKFAEKFESRFTSLECKTLRPEGFKQDNPPHICEELTCNAIEFTINFITDLHAKSNQDREKIKDLRSTQD